METSELLIGLQTHAFLVLHTLQDARHVSVSELRVDAAGGKLYVHVGPEIKKHLGQPDDVVPFGGGYFSHKAIWRPNPMVEVFCLLKEDQVEDMQPRESAPTPVAVVGAQ